MPIIQTDNGVVSFLEQGHGDTVTLLHGIQGTARTWDQVVPALERRYRVVRPNLRGRGQSVAPADSGAYRLRDFAGDLHATLAQLGPAGVLVAWSMGVSVTLEMLRRFPDAPVRALVLVSGTACPGSEACWFHGTTTDEVAAEASARAKVLGLTEAAPPHAVAASWLHVRQSDFRALLPSIHLPTLIIHGEEDDQCPIGHGRLMARLIPHARIEAWRGAGHNPMAHDAAKFAAVVDEFAAAAPRPR